MLRLTHTRPAALFEVVGFFIRRDLMSTVLITGASRGIGRAAALLFGKNGWNVAVNYRANEEAARSLKQELEEQL